jgi:hypothetical protein
MNISVSKGSKAQAESDFEAVGRRSFALLYAAVKFESTVAVAFEAKSAHVGKVALATAFDHRDDVVRIP